VSMLLIALAMSATRSDSSTEILAIAA